MIRTPFHPATAALLVLLALGASARAEEPVRTRRALELRAAPGDSGASVASLPEQAPVTRLEGRQGPWVQVRSAQGATGWVHLFDLGPPSASGGSSGSGLVSGALRGMTGLFDSGAPRQTSAVSGIRGLEAEDLARAQPDPAGVQRMADWRASESDARSYAGRVAWRPAAVDPLPVPAAPRTGETNREQLP